MVPRSHLIVLAVVALAAPLLPSTPAEAAARTSTGVRCTIVGTSGPDHLRGTSRRDVICGRGGRDHIEAGGGNDLVDGGSMRDWIYGGRGADRILGGQGRDTVYGQGGKDVLIGGTGADLLVGGAGADVIRGGAGVDTLVGLDGDDAMWGDGHSDLVRAGAGDDTVWGGAGDDEIHGSTGANTLHGGDDADQLFGGPGTDVIRGGAGTDALHGMGGDDLIWGEDQFDFIHGGEGNDTLWGGDGGDVIYGEGGADRVYGEAGEDTIRGADQDDDLNGGTGTDDVLGGAGADTCRYDVYDRLEECEPDLTAPEVLEVSISPSSVNSDTGDTQLTVRVHAVDDMVIVAMQGSLTGHRTDGGRTTIEIDGLRLVSGGIRDGWWEGTTTLPQWTPGGVLHAEIVALAGSGDGGVCCDPHGSLTVTSTAPDTVGPTVSVQSLSTTSVDVRSAARTVDIAVRGVDPKAGVGRIDICIMKPVTTPDWNRFSCVAEHQGVPLTSGTIKDGLWMTSLTIPKGSPTGTYNIQVRPTDRAGNGAIWLGPEAYAEYVGSRDCCNESHELAGATSRIHVTGS